MAIVRPWKLFDATTTSACPSGTAFSTAPHLRDGELRCRRMALDGSRPETARNPGDTALRMRSQRWRSCGHGSCSTPQRPPPVLPELPSRRLPTCATESFDVAEWHLTEAGRKRPETLAILLFG